MRSLAGAIWRNQSDAAKALPATHDPIFRELGNRVIKWIQDAQADGQLRCSRMAERAHFRGNMMQPSHSNE
jgi:hypothetical protein